MKLSELERDLHVFEEHGDKTALLMVAPSRASVAMIRGVGAGWDVLVFENGEPLFSRRCQDEAEPRFVPHVLKQDHLRNDWTA